MSHTKVFYGDLDHNRYQMQILSFRAACRLNIAKFRQSAFAAFGTLWDKVETLIGFIAL